MDGLYYSNLFCFLYEIITLLFMYVLFIVYVPCQKEHKEWNFVLYISVSLT